MSRGLKTKVHVRNKQTHLPNKNLNIGSKKKTFSKGLDSKHCIVTDSTFQTMMDHISISGPRIYTA